MTAAAGLHASPGVYALLLGSGASTGAGIPTGWGVVRQLVAKVAAAGSPDDPHAVKAALDDPELWWTRHGSGSLGYSQILSQLGPTAAARAALLNEFFVPTEEERTDGRKVPGPAHRAIVELVRRRTVRIIVTTNFDRLVETALNEGGIPPQVITSPNQIAGMEPLAHAACTVIKLHGDYSDLDKRNTIDELDHYPQEIMDLLDRILDEYGLIISGWSADWDIALVKALDRVKNRRYPLYWSTLRSVSAETQLLMSNRGAIAIPDVTADELFTDMVDRLEALDRLTDPVLTTTVAVERLKRALTAADGVIRVHDLLGHEITKITAAVHDWNARADKTLDNGLTMMAAQSQTLLHLLANGIYFDDDRRYVGQWIKVIDRLLRIRPARSFAENLDPRERVKHYPALLALLVGTLTATATEREDVAVAVLRQPRWQQLRDSPGPLPAANVLHYWNVLEHDNLKNLPRFAGQQQQFRFYSSDLAFTDLRSALDVLSLNPVDLAVLFEDTEYRVALAQQQFRPENPKIYALKPVVGLAYSHGFRMLGQLPAQGRFTTDSDYEAWGLTSETLPGVVEELRIALKEATRWTPL